MSYLYIWIGCIFFIFSGIGIFLSPIQQLDFMLVDWFFSHRTATLNTIALFLSKIGGMPFVLFFSLLWCFYLAWHKKYHHAVFISLGIGGSIVIGWLLKFAVNRPRPSNLYQLVESYGASFPSAHSLYAATLACLMILIFQTHPFQRFIVCFAVLWALVMGLSRIYLGVHYPTDVLAGWGMSLILVPALRLWLSHRRLGKTNYF